MDVPVAASSINPNADGNDADDADDVDDDQVLKFHLPFTEIHKAELLMILYIIL